MSDKDLNNKRFELIIVVNIEKEMLENEDVGAIKEGDVGVVCKDLKKKRTLEARRDQKRDHFTKKVL